MAKKPYEDNEDLQDEEEYQFEDDNDSSQVPKEPQQKRRRRLLTLKNIILAVVCLAIVVIFYRVSQFVIKGGSIKLPQRAVAEIHSLETKASKLETLPHKTSLPKVATATNQGGSKNHTPVHTPVDVSTHQNKLLDKMTEHQRMMKKTSQEYLDLATELKQSLKKSNSQQSQINQSLTNIEQKVITLQNKMQNMQNMQNRLSVALSNIHENQFYDKSMIAKRRAIAERKRTQYYVEAVVPGRVWLKSLAGESITVTTGDIIPGYGRITRINPYSGDVSTTSGVVIKYGME